MWVERGCSWLDDVDVIVMAWSPTVVQHESQPHPPVPHEGQSCVLKSKCVSVMQVVPNVGIGLLFIVKM